MDRNDANRLITRLEAISKSVSNLEKIAKILETANSNFVAYTDMVRKDIERHTFTPVDPKQLTPRFYVGCEVVVYDETHLRDGYRGIIRKLRENSADVELEDEYAVSLSGSQMIPLRERAIEPEHICIREYCSVCRDEENQVKDANDLPIPALVDDAKIGPNKFVPDAQGRLTPPQWRTNLGMLVVITTGLEDSHERQLMTEEAFQIYNAGLSETGTSENWKGDF